MERPKLITTKANDRYMFWCPGCKKSHVYYVSVSGMPNWTFNGDIVNPTFEPSLLCWIDTGPKEIQFRCHLFLKDGKIQFLDDCTHELKGKIVPLPDVPSEWGLELETGEP